ncbi:hypothetical protein [Haloferax gibbonsii]|uniref:hypothetical protein n=1 Tax=Haloferax gibbonsii TaxID=35746 RepID=UPI000AA269CD|nr:hypothetical protein [Haloferax gibbonsii]
MAITFERRAILGTLCGILTGLGAGCLSNSSTGLNQQSTATSTPVGTVNEADLTDWERSTDCITTGERDDLDEMYDSVIKVEQVKNSLSGDYAPIKFTELTEGEKQILRTVTEKGGYATCDFPDSFGKFVNRVREHKGRQEGTMVFLKRDNTYYGLYVEVTDQGISYVTY